MTEHFFSAESVNPNAGAQPLSLRCPKCHQRATLDSITTQDARLPEVIVGHRRCPNPACYVHIFVAYEPPASVIASYPAERLDFDATNLPPKVLASLEEAVTCHASGCYVAAAMLVRKTLEELAHDRQATGDNLKLRIRALRTKVVLPDELLDGMDDLRLLGNDAAHIESQDYATVGKEEVEVAIELTKEILKGVYQYVDLLARLKALKQS